MQIFIAALLLSAVPCQAEVLITNNVDVKTQKDGGKILSDLDSMKEVFMRSPEAHSQAMSSMMQTMSVSEAMNILKKDNISTPALVQIGDLAMGRQGNLRQPKGYAGLESARKLLNDMIYEAAMKYDEEIASCTDFYSKKCSALEKGQSDVLAANFIAASSRTLMSVASGIIERMTQEIASTKITLAEHLAQCKKQRRELTTRLEIVLGDIEVLTTILEMTDCKANKALLQLRRCHNECTKENTIEFAHHELQAKIEGLRSKLSKDLFQDTMADLFQGIESMQSAELVQTGSSPVSSRFANKTSNMKPPAPKTQKLGACSDPYKGYPPPPGSKSGSGCQLTPGSCYKLQGRFLRIQAGIVDEKEKLELQLARLNKKCAEVKAELQEKLEQAKSTKSSAQSDLDDATKRENKANEESIATTKYNVELNADVKSRMTTCRDNYAKLEGEMCALKKIRGELYKMKGDGKHSAFFEDCSMGSWVPEECTKKCGGGEQNLTRGIASAANGGAKCLPTRQLKSCNNEACPVDCVQEPWSGWSKCSAECGGGVEQRVRRTLTPMKYGGTSCGDTKQEIECNTQACDVDCQLSAWTAWSSCSKDCGGGTRKRFRYVVKAATGAGKCANRWAPERLEYTECAKNRCQPSVNHTTLACLHTKIDTILLIDGSGSVGQRGWDAEIALSKKFVEAFQGTEEVDAQMSVIVYSGPRTWGTYRKCFARKTSKEDRKKACNINTVTHFTNDLAGVQKKIAALKWPKGGTLTSKALKTAESELMLGRAGLKPNVVVLTDGKPMSKRSTRLASQSIRKKARLLWVPITRNAPLKDIKKWATRKWEENVFSVKTFTDLSAQRDAIVTHMIASMCPTPTDGMFN